MWRTTERVRRSTTGSDTLAAAEAEASADDAATAGTIWYLQWLRALGAVAIVLLHAVRSVELVDELEAMVPALVRAETLGVVILSRWAVPAFLMMSGALMLDPAREMPLRKLARHIWRIVFVLATFGFAFCVMEVAYDAKTVDARVLVVAFANLLRGHSWDHLWYLYATLGLYVLTPFLRWAVRRLSWRSLCAACVALWLLCCGTPTLVVLGCEEGPVQVVATGCGWAFPLPYYLAGYLLHHGGGRILRRWPAWVAVGALAASLGVLAMWVDIGELVLPEYALVLPFGAGVFVLARRFLDSRQVGAPWICVLADYSLGIYVIHPLFAHLLIDLGPVAGVAACFGSMGILLLQLAIVTLGIFGSMGIVRCVRRVPGFAKKI